MSKLFSYGMAQCSECGKLQSIDPPVWDDQPPNPNYCSCAFRSHLEIIPDPSPSLTTIEIIHFEITDHENHQLHNQLPGVDGLTPDDIRACG